MYNPELIYNFDFKFFRQIAEVAFGFTSSLGYILLLMLAGKVLDDKANTKTVLFVIFSFVCYFLSGIFFKEYLVNIDIRVICISMILLAGLASLLFSIFTSIGFILGIPLGFYFMTLMMNAAGDSLYYIPALTWGNILLSALITFSLSIGVNTLFSDKINDLDMVEALKDVD